jgi:transcriptional regulator with XRE-family HTH domain
VTQPEAVPEPKRPHKVIAERVREVRTARGLSGVRLAEEMTKVGIKWDRSIVANLENGRRSTISVEELLALAYVLDVAPVHLMVPLDPDGWYAVTPDNYATRNSRARAWIRGTYALLDHTDERKYFSEVPKEEWIPPRKLDGEQKDELFKQLADEGLMDYTKVADTGEVSDYDPDSGKRLKRNPDGFPASDEEGAP